MTPDARLRLTRAVEHAESHSGAEVVLVGYARADGYLDIAFRNALAATLAMVGFVLLAPFEVPHDAVFPLTGLTALLAFFLSRIDAVARLTSTEARRTEAIDSAVAQAFFTRGVHKTRERIGMLVAWFELEGTARVVFDTGLEARVPADVRARIVQSIVDACAQSTDEARAVAVAALGDSLAPFVPPDATRQNELDNAPTVGGVA
jgi:putative membrane protein